MQQQSIVALMVPDHDDEFRGPEEGTRRELILATFLVLRSKPRVM